MRTWLSYSYIQLQPLRLLSRKLKMQTCFSSSPRLQLLFEGRSKTKEKAQKGRILGLYTLAPSSGNTRTGHQKPKLGHEKSLLLQSLILSFYLNWGDDETCYKSLLLSHPVACFSMSMSEEESRVQGERVHLVQDWKTFLVLAWIFISAIWLSFLWNIKACVLPKS